MRFASLQASEISSCFYAPNVSIKFESTFLKILCGILWSFGNSFFVDQNFLVGFGPILPASRSRSYRPRSFWWVLVLFCRPPAAVLIGPEVFGGFWSYFAGLPQPFLSAQKFLVGFGPILPASRSRSYRPRTFWWVLVLFCRHPAAVLIGPELFGGFWSYFAGIPQPFLSAQNFLVGFGPILPASRSRSYRPRSFWWVLVLFCRHPAAVLIGPEVFGGFWSYFAGLPQPFLSAQKFLVGFGPILPASRSRSYRPRSLVGFGPILPASRSRSYRPRSFWWVLVLFCRPPAAVLIGPELFGGFWSYFAGIPQPFLSAQNFLVGFGPILPASRSRSYRPRTFWWVLVLFCRHPAAVLIGPELFGGFWSYFAGIPQPFLSAQNFLVGFGPILPASRSRSYRPRTFWWVLVLFCRPPAAVLIGPELFGGFWSYFAGIPQPFLSAQNFLVGFGPILPASRSRSYRPRTFWWVLVLFCRHPAAVLIGPELFGGFWSYFAGLPQPFLSAQNFLVGFGPILPASRSRSYRPRTFWWVLVLFCRHPAAVLIGPC